MISACVFHAEDHQVKYDFNHMVLNVEFFNTILWHSCVPYQAEQPEEHVTDLRSGKQVVTKFHTHQRLQEGNSPGGKQHRFKNSACNLFVSFSALWRSSYVIAIKCCFNILIGQVKKKKLANKKKNSLTGVENNAYPNTQHCVPTRLH